MRAWLKLACGVALLGLAGLTSANADTRSLAEIKAGRRVGAASPDAAVADEAGTATNAAGPRMKAPAGWLRGSGSGYEKALEIQQATGMDMLILFGRENVKDEKGLLHWFKKKSLSDGHVLKQMRAYVKVEIEAGANDSRTRALIDEYHVAKTPRLVVRQPSGVKKRVDVFNWPGGGPELVKPNDLVQGLKDASSPSYREEDKKD